MHCRARANRARANRAGANRAGANPYEDSRLDSMVAQSRACCVFEEGVPRTENQTSGRGPISAIPGPGILFQFRSAVNPGFRCSDVDCELGLSVV